MSDPAAPSRVGTPPHLSPRSIPRPRVRAAIEDRVGSDRVTVVCAPSGFGKTSVVAEWSASHPGRVAWLTLGPFDDEPSRLGARVVRAIQALSAEEPGLSTFARLDPDDTSAHELFDILTGILDALPEPVFLVVDDAHRAGPALTDGLLGALIEAGSPRLRVIVVGTGGIDGLLSRWVLTSTHGSLNDRTLAFDRTEIAEVLPHVDASTGHDLDTVLASTRGWPIAVQFVRFAGRDGDGIPVDALLRDYVREHVLRDLPPELRSLAVHTAVCREMTVALAADVSGLESAGALLRQALRMGLFLDTYDRGDATTYRWHPLFAQLCRSLNDEQDPDLNLRSHRAAAAHLEDVDPLAAITHWTSAGATQEAARVVSERWMRIVIGSDAVALDRICAGFPAPLHDDPTILLIRASAHGVLGDMHTAHLFVAQAVARAGADPDETFTLTLARAQLFLLDDRSALADAAERVHAGLIAYPEVDRQARAALLFLMGWAGMRHRMTPLRTIEHLRSAAREADSLGDGVLAARARRLLAFVLAWAGAMSQSRAVLHELGSSGEDASPWLSHGGGAAAVASGLIAYWADDLERAEREFSRVLGGARPAPSFRGVAGIMLALTAARSDDMTARARALLELEALPSGDRIGASWGAFRHMVDAVLADADGRHPHAVELAKRHAAGDLPMVTVMLAEIVRRSGDTARALEMLRGLHAYREVSYVRASTRLTAALVQRARGAHRLAHELCEQMLEEVHREGLDRIVVDAEGPVRSLLGAHLERGTAFELLAIRGARAGAMTGPISTLSPRERAVLDLLGTSKSAAEIAAMLQVSTNTLKTHTRAIYRKLGVSSRQEAIEAAR